MKELCHPWEGQQFPNVHSVQIAPQRGIRHNRRFPCPIRTLGAGHLGMDLEPFQASYGGCCAHRHPTAHHGDRQREAQTALFTPAAHLLCAGDVLPADRRCPYANAARLRQRLPSVFEPGNSSGHQMVRQEISSRPCAATRCHQDRIWISPACRIPQRRGRLDATHAGHRSHIACERCL